MEKATFLAVLKEIVESFEDPAFQAGMAEAKTKGEVAKLIQLPTDLQNRAFVRHGIDAVSGAGEFKAAGKEHGLSPEAAPYLARMKAALGR